MKYIDIHSHLDFKDFDGEREQVIADMKSKLIGTFNVGTTLETSKNAIALADTHENIWAIVGVHPLYTKESVMSEINLIEPLISNDKCVAIGECGLDFFREADDAETKDRQLKFFEKQIELAITHQKPLMIHCREAYQETLEVLESYKKSHPELHAHFHFFTESTETAKRILDSNFTVSFTGVITFVSEYEDLVKYVPFESMMVETDSPYVAPKSVRGTRNDPTNIIEIVEKISQIKGKTHEETAQMLVETTKKTFGI